MRERKEETHSRANQDATSSSASESANQRETPSRRELIERYGKYAIVAAPLLLFVSQAHAIHSKP